MGVILIAFERESEQSALEQLLMRGGHRIVKAPNGLTALDLARREPPDLIVSDIVLPRMDGFALCRKWKQDERLQAVPFIFYTRRHDDPKYERFALELGAERFLSRSAEASALGRVVAELLAGAPRCAQPTVRLPSIDEAAAQKAALREQSLQAAHAQLEAQLRKQVDVLRSELEDGRREHARLQSQRDDSQAAQQRLAEGEARFRRVFEANRTPMWIADHATGGFIAVNEAALELFGCTRAEFLGMPAKELLAPETAGSRVRMHRRKDGTALPLHVAAREIEFDGRRADLASVTDLTAETALERQLRELTAGVRDLFNAAADGCWVLDQNGRIIEVNDAYCRMSGYSREQVLAMRPGDIEKRSPTETTVRLQPDRAAGGERGDLQHRRSDGSQFDVETSIGQLPNGGSVMLIRDASLQRRERVMQRKAQQQSEFLIALGAEAERLDESEILRRALEHASAALLSPLSFIYTVLPAERTLTLAAWREHDRTHVRATEAPPRKVSEPSAFAECLRTGRSAASNEPERAAGDELPDLQRCTLAPMLDAGETVALLGAANRAAPYSDDDQQLLAALAQGVQHVLIHKRTHSETLSALHRAEVALQGMIESFVRISERHDPYTAGSARRLATLAVALGREAGLDGERQHALRIAALLHDVGNVAVPPSILGKPAPLTEAEFALMRTHVEEGCQLLADIDFGAPIADIVYQSHERYDGSGYPRGLKREEILLEARILGVADTVEAMCSPRPYRPAAGIDAAMEEITRGAGRRYDPQVVAACMRLVRERGFTLPE